MSAGKNKPNVLLIMCDQLCASVLGAYGGTADTPNIGRLAENGTVFDAAYCQTPFCSPSRASLITGLYPHRHGIVGNVNSLDYPAMGVGAQGSAGGEGITNRDVMTESILHANGYKTAHLGKWHISSGDALSCYDSMYREHQEYGFEMREVFERVEKQPRDRYMDWYGWKLPVTLNREYAECLNALPERLKNRTLYEFYSKFGRLELPVEDTFDYKIASKGVDNIMSAKEPFMLTCSFNMPHDPNVVPSPYYESVDMRRIKADASLPCDAAYLKDLSKDVPAHAGDAFLREFLRVYYAAVNLVDEQIGRLLNALEKRGIAENTVIILTADHGDMAGGHGMFWKATTAFYEEVARVPLIISAPGTGTTGTTGTTGRNLRYGKPVELVDVMPTILELCGFKSPANIDGVSAAPVFSGGESKKNTALCERLRFGSGDKRAAHTSDENYNFMLRTGRYKYVIHHNNGNTAQLLFDLESDPGEYTNLIGLHEHKETEREMRSLLRVRLAESGYALEVK